MGEPSIRDPKQPGTLQISAGQRQNSTRLLVSLCSFKQSKKPSLTIRVRAGVHNYQVTLRNNQRLRIQSCAADWYGTHMVGLERFGAMEASENLNNPRFC
jgi:hypothetical protein